MAKPLKAKDKDISNALAILIQALIVQLMDSELLTVEQGERVFDAAAKKAKAASPEVEEVVQYVHDALQWDKLYEASSRRKKPK
jgi:hypothetical protein